MKSGAQRYLQNTRRILKALVLTTACSSMALAQAGNAGLAFLKLGVAGRGVSMADAMTACADGAAATYYNPAGIAPSDTTPIPTQILFTHKEWIQDTRAEFLAGAVGLSSRDAIGVSVNTATTADIEIRTRPGPAEGTFTSRDFALAVSYGRRINDDLRIGATAKYLYEKILVDYAAGYAFDVGAQCKTPVEGLSVGFLLANIGSMSDFRTSSMQLPSRMRFGAAYSLPLESALGTLTLVADLTRNIPDKQNLVSIGGEFTFSQVVAARAGYEFGSDTRGLGAGIGVHYGVFSLDYGYAPIAQDLGNTHTITVALTL